MSLRYRSAAFSSHAPRNIAPRTASGVPANAVPANAKTAASQAVVLDTDLQLLTQVGYSAVMRGMGDDAKPIFDALAEWAPDNAAAAIGHALIALLRGDFDRAITILKRDGITRKVSGAEAKAVLVIALQLSGRHAEAQAVMRDISRVAGPAMNLVQMFR